MKAVILAGGFGTRISEESRVRPKPMVEIGDMPILWHIMKIYSAYGINDFIICCGYKGFVIKEFFAHYFFYKSDITFDLVNNRMKVHENGTEPWKVTLVDTGESTMTGGRLKRVRNYVDNNTFCFTYGDGISDINIRDLIDFHRAEATLATMTAVQPPGKYGVFNLTAEQIKVRSFTEKPAVDGTWINGGFFVLEPGVFDYITDDSTSWEEEPLRNLAEEGMLSAYRHHGFWHPMDTLRDKNLLEEFWRGGKAPWKVW
jgi:glucose-1-phosphate cytidylyltransferase